MSDKQYTPGEYYQPLFDYLQDQFGVHALESDMTEINEIIRKMKALHPSESAGVNADELWDEFSELIDDDIDSLTRWAGSAVIDKENFKKLIVRLRPSGASAVWMKASERLPDKKLTDVPLKYRGKNYTGHFWYDRYFNFPFGAVGIDDDGIAVPEELENVYWLDESPSLSPDQSGKEEMAFAEWLAENTRILRQGKITLYRYCDKMNEWGNYILEDIYQVYKEL